jgi:hypothetical protein
MNTDACDNTVCELLVVLPGISKENISIDSANTSELYHTLCLDVKESPNIENESDWLTQHQSVGRKIAKYFASMSRRSTKRKRRTKIAKLYFGEVHKFSPGNGSNDVLYHVQYEDGDSEDLDQTALNEGVKLFRNCGIKNK